MNDDSELMLLARQAARQAYSPYSRIRVGAALQAEDGRIFTGCNVENGSYGLTICAERTAVFAAVAAGVRRIRALAVTVDESVPGSRMPCGACRQVMQEFMAPDARVEVDGEGSFALSELLPRPFHL